MANDTLEAKRERERPLGPESKIEVEAKPCRVPLIGSTVVVRVSENGFLPLLVDRVLSPTVVRGLITDSAFTPAQRASGNVPYSKDIGGWRWPEEVAAK